jgi:hypothetical protein
MVFFDLIFHFMEHFFLIVSNGRVQPRCGAQWSNVGCDPVLGGLVYIL